MVFGVVNGDELGSIETYNCRELLFNAGCDEHGLLLEENVCLTSAYKPSKPPKPSTTIQVGFLKSVKLFDVDEGLGLIKLFMDEVVLHWEDPRVKINLNRIENEKLRQTPIPGPERFKILVLPVESMCSSLFDGNGRLVIWLPGQIHFKGLLKSNPDDSKNPMGISEIGIRLSDPMNKTSPLIYIEVKFRLTIECRFNYKKYPMDTQICGLRFTSDNLNRLNTILIDPVGKCKQIDEGYELNGFHITTACVNDTKIGIDFTLKRDIMSYLLQFYLPSAIIVFVSQTSFVIPLSATPGRISLVVTLFLALTNIFINEQVKMLTDYNRLAFSNVKT